MELNMRERDIGSFIGSFIEEVRTAGAGRLRKGAVFVKSRPQVYFWI